MIEGPNFYRQKTWHSLVFSLRNALMPFLVILVFPGCLSYRIENPEKYRVEGTQYGMTKGNFFPRWWSLYERGRSFADGEFWIEAETDLRRAVSMRATDKRMSRTYGIHYIRYFGNRELGVVLFKQGRTEKAIPYLIRSLEDDPTEKARYFLNLCHRQLAQKATDNTNPVIQLDPIPRTTNSRNIRVTGKAIDNLAVDSVLINGYASGHTLKPNQLDFARTISLVSYKGNLITITALDSSGNKTSQKIPVILDIDSPVISVISSDPRAIVLSVTDDHSSTVEYEYSDSLNLIKIAGNQYTFQPLEMASEYSVIFSDNAGNRNGITIEKNQLRFGMYHTNPPPFHSGAVAPILLASTSPNINVLPSPRKGYPHGPAIKPPTMVIDLPGPALNVFQEFIIISGKIYGEFSSLKINGTPKITYGKDARFSYMEYLGPW